MLCTSIRSGVSWCPWDGRNVWEKIEKADDWSAVNVMIFVDVLYFLILDIFFNKKWKSSSDTKNICFVSMWPQKILSESNSSMEKTLWRTIRLFIDITFWLQMFFSYQVVTLYWTKCNCSFILKYVLSYVPKWIIDSTVFKLMRGLNRLWRFAVWLCIVRCAVETVSLNESCNLEHSAAEFSYIFLYTSLFCSFFQYMDSIFIFSHKYLNQTLILYITSNNKHVSKLLQNFCLANPYSLAKVNYLEQSASKKMHAVFLIFIDDCFCRFCKGHVNKTMTKECLGMNS